MGKKNYNHLCQLIAILYKNFDEEKYLELIKLINKIYEKVINTKISDFDLYFKELENMGYKVRKLK